jgi:hypothetical protein
VVVGLIPCFESIFNFKRILNTAERGIRSAVFFCEYASNDSLFCFPWGNKIFWAANSVLYWSVLADINAAVWYRAVNAAGIL